MNFEYDESAIAQADKAADRLTEGGAYVGQFTSVEGMESEGGAKGLTFNFESPGVGTTSFALWTQGKDGKPTFSVAQVQAMMFLVGIKALKAVPGKVMKWEANEKGQREKVEGEGDTYPDLCKKPIGVVLQKELYTTGKGSTGERMNLYGLFQPETKLMASEIKDRKTTPVKLARLLAGLKVKDARKAVSEEPAQPSMGIAAEGY